ncbi:MAG: acetate/propionate family kinase, partial [Opitutales bacterium]
SLKAALFERSNDALHLRAGAKVSGLASDEANLSLKNGDGESLEEHGGDFADQESALDAVFSALAGQPNLPEPEAIAHRVVHGGLDFSGPVVVDDDVQRRVEVLTPLAPLHQPGALAGLKAARRRHPQLPQVLCFDTAFFHAMPDLAKRLPFAPTFAERGLIRYGFHGISYEGLRASLGEELRPRAIFAHLGSGASMTAVRDGQPVDMTMSFSPTAGLLMSTRSGDLDPGVLIYLQRECGYSVDAVETLVERQSGFAGMTDGTKDMQALLERRASDPVADLAVSLFCYRARKHLGALATVLGGVDQLVFTGGIGENAAPVRAEICAGLGFLGINIDGAANETGAEVISPAAAAVEVRVVPADEERTMAAQAAETLGGR